MKRLPGRLRIPYSYYAKTLKKHNLKILILPDYRKFPNRGAGRLGETLGALSLGRGHFHLPVAIYRMKIGPFLAEIWPKTSRNPELGRRPGAKRGGAPLLENLRY